MSKPNVICVLGADRVGKTTIISNTYKGLVEKKYDVKLLHFSGQKPHHDSPIQQYIEPFSQALEAGHPVILCDRGFSEVCFYDKFRRHVDTPESFANEAEKFFTENSNEIAVVMVKRKWEWSRPHHIEEIKQLHPDVSEYGLSWFLEQREKEHYAYYEYMEDFIRTKSLLEKKTIIISPDFSTFSLHWLV